METEKSQNPGRLQSFRLAYWGGFGAQLIAFLVLLTLFLQELNWLLTSVVLAAFAVVSFVSGFSGILARSWNTLPKVLLGGAVGLASCVVAVASFLFWTVLVTPIAKLWYMPGFDDAATKALAELPTYETACIFDDSQNIFVTSIAQLDVDRMIERAVSVRGPLRAQWRDPHFRVYSGETTYYWSFRDERFHEFSWNRHLWDLTELSDRHCRADSEHLTNGQGM